MYRDVADSDWSAQHLARHDVTLDEARDVLLRNRHVERTGKNDTTLIYGRSDAGRYLLLVIAPARADPTLAFVVTARDMTTSEKRFYQRHRR